MTLEQLSSKDLIALCRRAATASVRRLHALGRRVDPSDAPLIALFEKLIRDGVEHLSEIHRFEDQVHAPPVKGERDLDQIISGFFPSLTRAPGEAFIDRETGPYFAECIEQDAARFYRVLAERAPDEESRAFFRHSGDERESRVRFVRNVLL